MKNKTSKTGKNSYKKPVLTSYGSLGELTTSGSQPMKEGDGVGNDNRRD